MGKMNLVNDSFEWQTDGDNITFNVDGSDTPFSVPESIIAQVKAKAISDKAIQMREFLDPRQLRSSQCHAQT